MAEVCWDTNIQATEATLQTGEFTTWYRTWGSGPLKAVFLHGGPGNCVEDYSDVNFKVKHGFCLFDQFSSWIPLSGLW